MEYGSTVTIMLFFLLINTTKDKGRLNVFVFCLNMAYLYNKILFILLINISMSTSIYKELKKVYNLSYYQYCTLMMNEVILLVK
jgi:hypothetical protein